MNCDNCKHRMNRIFEKCRPWNFVGGTNHMCVLYEPMEGVNESEGCKDDKGKRGVDGNDQ
jgi:hypothetical protein